MIEVRLEKLNELNELIWELSCIAHLQIIYEIDKQEEHTHIKEFDDLKGAAAEYLINKEIETVSKIRNLICDDSFFR